MRTVASWTRVRSLGFQGAGSARAASASRTTRGSAATSVQRGGELGAVLGDQRVVLAEDGEQLEHGLPGCLPLVVGPDVLQEPLKRLGVPALGGCAFGVGQRTGTIRIRGCPRGHVEPGQDALGL